MTISLQEMKPACPGGHATRGTEKHRKIEKAKDPRNTLKRLILYLGRFKAGLAAVLVFVLIYTVLGLLGPYLMGWRSIIL